MVGYKRRVALCGGCLFGPAVVREVEEKEERDKKKKRKEKKRKERKKKILENFPNLKIFSEKMKDNL
jgi:iron only hydrogenase large subunit-like protein